MAISSGVDNRWLREYPSHSYIDRQNGEVYRDAWTKAVLCGTPWVAIENWNIYHEPQIYLKPSSIDAPILGLSQFSQLFNQTNLIRDDLISNYKTPAEVTATLTESDVYSSLTLSLTAGDGKTRPIQKADKPTWANCGMLNLKVFSTWMKVSTMTIYSLPSSAPTISLRGQVQ